MNILHAYFCQWTRATVVTLLLVVLFLAGGYTALFLLIHNMDNTDPKEINDNPYPQIQKH